MPYVSSFEELAREEGRIDGLHESILTVIESKFDAPLAPEVALQLQSIRDASQLNSIHRALFKIESMDAVVKQIEAHRQ